MHTYTNRLAALGFLLALLACAPAAAHGQQPAPPTAFTYHGRLSDAAAADGTYDMEFRLYDTADAGAAPAALAVPAVQVTGRRFTAQLDFGAGLFDGTARYIEIGLRPAGSGAPYTTPSRQPPAVVPYAVGSVKAVAAAQAQQAQNAAQLGGLSPDQYVLASDPRLSDARPPAAGGSNYIQNTSTPQHLVGARAGQTMAVRLEAASKAITFSVMSPGGGGLLSGNVRGWGGALRETGDYYVTVSAGEGVSAYALTVTIR